MRGAPSHRLRGHRARREKVARPRGRADVQAPRAGGTGVRARPPLGVGRVRRPVGWGVGGRARPAAGGGRGTPPRRLIAPRGACPPHSYPWVRACLTLRKDSTGTHASRTHAGRSPRARSLPERWLLWLIRTSGRICGGPPSDHEVVKPLLAWAGIAGRLPPTGTRGDPPARA